MRCDEHNQNENKLCDLKSNNCKDGLKCVEQDDGCDNGIGRCVKTGKPRMQNITKFVHFLYRTPMILNTIHLFISNCKLYLS